MRIFKYLKKYWFFAILAPLFMVGEVLMDLVQPLLMAEIVDVHLINEDFRMIVLTGLKMLGLVLIGGVFGILSGVFTNLAAFKYSNDMRKDVFDHIVRLSFEQTDKFTTGSLVTRVTNDITQVTNIVAMSMRMLVRTFMQFAGGIVALLTINPKFSSILLYILPVLLVAIIIILAIIIPKFSIMQSRVDDVNASVFYG
jgi:ATP-binding cassette subfamily B protein